MAFDAVKQPEMVLNRVNIQHKEARHSVKNKKTGFLKKREFIITHPFTLYFYCVIIFSRFRNIILYPLEKSGKFLFLIHYDPLRLFSLPLFWSYPVIHSSIHVQG